MRLLVSGGGTGGHIYPALALIEDLKEKDPTAEILYVGTSRGLESRIVPDAGIDFKTIEIQGFKRSLSGKGKNCLYGKSSSTTSCQNQKVGSIKRVRA